MALSAAAGPKLQQECKLIGKVDTGEIVVTSGANLACKHVFHTSSAEWENGAGEKVSTNIIFFLVMKDLISQLIITHLPAYLNRRGP